MVYRRLQRTSPPMSRIIVRDMTKEIGASRVCLLGREVYRGSFGIVAAESGVGLGGANG